jgi:hypothetical protein
MPTNKDILNRGFKYGVIALPMFFIGPSVIYNAFQNQKHDMFIPILGVGIIICIMAAIMLFRALKTILKSQSDDPRP